jgi:hypothetical protein
MDILEEHFASIFMVEEKTKQETSMKVGGNQTEMTLLACVCACVCVCGGWDQSDLS